MKDKNKPTKKIIIKGVTSSGKTFRPSNWAERMGGKLSTFKKHRIQYSPMLKPITKDGYKCVVLDPKLKETNPSLFDSIMYFANTHDLTICDNNNHDDDQEKK